MYHCQRLGSLRTLLRSAILESGALLLDHVYLEINRCQILTYRDGPRAERVKVWGCTLCPLSPHLDRVPHEAILCHLTRVPREAVYIVTSPERGASWGYTLCPLTWTGCLMRLHFITSPERGASWGYTLCPLTWAGCLVRLHTLSHYLSRVPRRPLGCPAVGGRRNIWSGTWRRTSVRPCRTPASLAWWMDTWMDRHTPRAR